MQNIQEPNVTYTDIMIQPSLNLQVQRYTLEG